MADKNQHSSTPLWERSKENAAPLERGRRVAVLEQSLAVDIDRRNGYHNLIEHYEQLVRPTEDRLPHQQQQRSDNHDPLVHWLSYIKFHQETFPTDTHAEFLLLERCLRALSAMQCYADDPRFIRVCCLYAEKTNRASEIFNYLYSQKIGANVALFWVAWAFVAEKEENFSFADKILEKGIRKQAQPLNYLLQRQKQFQRRMSRYWLNTTQRSDQMDDEIDENGPRREIFGGLTDDRIRRNDRTHNQRSRTALPRSNLATFTDRSTSRTYLGTKSILSNHPLKNNSFAIFVEQGVESENEFQVAESPLSAHEFRKLEREQDSKKENTIDPERWNERGALSTSYNNQVSAQRILPPLAFAIHVDDDCAAKLERNEIHHRQQAAQHRNIRDDRTFREREDGGLVERLANDPLRYVRNPSQLATDDSSSSDRNAARNNKSQEKTRGFNQRLMKSDSGHEQSFEEARGKANYYYIAPTTCNLNRFCVFVSAPDADRSLISMDDEESVDMASLNDMDKDDQHDVDKPKSCGTVHNHLRRTENSFETHNTSVASSTVDEPSGMIGGRDEPTINTQWALRELSMMFSSPALALNNEGHSSNTCAPTLNQSRDSPVDDGADIESINELVRGFNGEETSSCTSIEAYIDCIREAAPTSLNRIPSQSGLRVFGSLSQSDIVPAYDEITTDSARSFCVADERQGTTNYSEGLKGSQPKSQTKPSIRMHQTCSFHIFHDAASKVTEQDENVACRHNVSLQYHRKSRVEYMHEEEGDTATFSLLGDALQALNDISLQSPETTKDQQKPMGRTSNEPLCYGSSRALGSNLDVSFIPLTGDDTNDSFSSLLAKAFNYSERHQEDIKTAADRMKTAAAGSLKPRKTLVDNLMRENFVFHLPTHDLPKALNATTCLEGVVVTIDRSSSIVKKELGRGAYGVVLLLGDAHNDSRRLAVKTQSPVGSLAWEYEILSKINNRIKGTNSISNLFPSAVSFVSLANGAMLSMTACSSTGFNLVDLVNAYTQLGEHVPEVISLHYTARMLNHLEQLHWKAKILHCDVKPDNWVLSQSTGTPSGSIEASDLSLVDFGRSIDLTMLRRTSNESINDVLLFGNACPDEMMSVPMRTGLPWSFDVDTFGLCASAYVLLFGTHMKIHKTHCGKWIPAKSFDQFIETAIWIELFDTLLNIDEVTKVAIGSRSHSLRRMRTRIEDCLIQQQSALLTALNLQTKMLSSQSAI